VQPPPTLEREQALWAKGYRFVAGIDEVGRGPLAGPVVAAAVIFPPGAVVVEGLRDSKAMTHKQRLRVAALVREQSLAWAVSAASVREIDRRNILRATALAMRRAVARLPVLPDHIIIDGSPLPELRLAHESVVKGDRISQSIAAASVLAKCARDHLMELLGQRYPAFHWDRNKGYATADHTMAIDEHGLTPHHRRSFAPVGQLMLF
jgi:ribonuclease HII